MGGDQRYFSGGVPIGRVSVAGLPARDPDERGGAPGWGVGAAGCAGIKLGGAGVS